METIFQRFIFPLGFALVVEIPYSQNLQLCPQWKDPNSKIVELSPDSDLQAAADAAVEGTTLLLKPGLYSISKTLRLTRQGITLRGATGNPDDVILDGNRVPATLVPTNFAVEVVSVVASNITVADLSLRHASTHCLHAYPGNGADIEGIRMRNLHVYDCSEQLIKVNSDGGNPAHWVDRGILECSVVEFKNNQLMSPVDDYFYTGGLDAHGTRDWVVRRNLFKNIQRNGKLMEHAVHFWKGPSGTVVEDNRFEDTYRAIGFGMLTAPNGFVRNPTQPEYVDHSGGIIRNNVIFNHKDIHLEVGIEIMNAKGVEIYQNTVFAADKPFSGIEIRWPRSTAKIRNNILSHNLRVRDGAESDAKANLEDAPAELFQNPGAGDFRLASTAKLAIDKGEKLEAGKAESDISGLPRLGVPDLGASEFSLGAPVQKRSIRHGKINTSHPGMPTLGLNQSLDGRTRLYLWPQLLAAFP